MRNVNQAGIDLIKSFEGFRPEPYRDSGGVWTIGYGHIREVSEDSPPITEEEGENLLIQDLGRAEREVERFVQVPLTDNQFAALVSLVFNVGTTPLLKTLGAKLTEQDYTAAADEFQKWTHVGGNVIEGLVRRRDAEKALFLS